MNAPMPIREPAAAPEAECGCAPIEAAPDQLDEQVRSALACATQGMTLASFWLAGLDWALHLAVSPGKVDTSLGEWMSAMIAATGGMLPGPATAQPAPGATAPPSDLRFADLAGADLSGADLSGADLTGADLTDADLSRAYLGRATLRGADLREADLRYANLDGVIGADFTGALNVPERYLKD